MWLNVLDSQFIPKIPVGQFANLGVIWLRSHFGFCFELLRAFLDKLLTYTLEFLLWPQPYILIFILCVFAWLGHRSWKTVLITALGFFLVINQGYWEASMQTLALLFWSFIFCMGLGIPLGILFAHQPNAYAWINPFLNLMQTLPTFVYLIPAIIFFRIGMVPGLIATVIFVLPTPIRLTQLGIVSTPPTLLEAGRSFGASPRQLLWKIELFYALPQIRESISQTIMLSLSMVVIAASVGGNGLGVPVYRALQQYNAALGFEAGFVIVVVSIVLDRLFRL